VNGPARRARRLPAAGRCVALVVALELGLGGCAAPLELRPPANDPARVAALAALGEWTAQGRFAVRTGTDGSQGDLDWQQRGSDALIRVSGPLGAGALEIHWSPEALTVSGRDGAWTQSWHDSAEAERFLAERLGWSFPADSVRYWLLGIADPAAPADWRAGADGELPGFRQHGWSVSYERYAQVEGFVLPVRLTLESPAVRLRVLIDHWRIGPGARG
jgi:outer membrane lipoprotein LolB